MKQILIALTGLLVYVLISCNQKQKDTKTAETTNNSHSAIEGNWETVSFEANGKQAKPKRVPQQFKMFNDGFFSLVMYDDSGKFYLACAGPYEVNGNMY